MAISLFKNPVKENTHFVITAYIFRLMASFFFSFFPDLCLKFQKLSSPHFGRTQNQFSHSPITVSGKQMIHWITNFSHNGTPKVIKSSVHYLYLSDVVLNPSCRLFSLTFSYGTAAQTDLVSFLAMSYFPMCKAEPSFRQTTWGKHQRIQFLVYPSFQYQHWKRSFWRYPAYD